MYDAAWALTNVVAGTSAQTQTVVDAGAVPILVKLITSSNLNIREQAVWALGNIAGDGPILRDLVLCSGIVPPMLRLIKPFAPVFWLRTAVSTLARLCRFNNPCPPFEVVKQFLPTLRQLLYYHSDKEVLSDSCWALAYLTEGSNHKIEEVVQARVVPRLVELLSHEELTVTAAALRAIGCIVTGTDTQTQAVIDNGALPSLGKLLSHSDVHVQKDAAWTLSNIMAGTSDQIQAVLDNNLMDPIVIALDKSEFKVQKHLVWAIKNLISGGTFQQIFTVVLGGRHPYRA